MTSTRSSGSWRPTSRPFSRFRCPWKIGGDLPAIPRGPTRPSTSTSPVADFSIASTTLRGPDAAAENFRQALRLDPDFALAHVGLSEALWEIYLRDIDRAALEEAEDHARRARELAPGIAGCDGSRWPASTGRPGARRRPPRRSKRRLPTTRGRTMVQRELGRVARESWGSRRRRNDRCAPPPRCGRTTGPTGTRSAISSPPPVSTRNRERPSWRRRRWRRLT